MGWKAIIIWSIIKSSAITLGFYFLLDYPKNSVLILFGILFIFNIIFEIIKHKVVKYYSEK